MFNILWSKETLEAIKMQSKPNICDGHIGIIEIHVYWKQNLVSNILYNHSVHMYYMQPYDAHSLTVRKFKIHNFII